MPFPVSWRSEVFVSNGGQELPNVEDALQRLMAAVEREGAGKTSFDGASVYFKRGWLYRSWGTDGLFYLLSGGSLTVAEAGKGLRVSYRLNFLASLLQYAALMLIPLSDIVFVDAGMLSRSRFALIFMLMLTSIYVMFYLGTIAVFPGFVRRVLASPLRGPTQSLWDVQLR